MPYRGTLEPRIGLQLLEGVQEDERQRYVRRNPAGPGSAELAELRSLHGGHVQSMAFPNCTVGCLLWQHEDTELVWGSAGMFQVFTRDAPDAIGGEAGVELEGALRHFNTRSVGKQHTQNCSGSP